METEQKSTSWVQISWDKHQLKDFLMYTIKVKEKNNDLKEPWNIFYKSEEKGNKEMYNITGLVAETRYDISVEVNSRKFGKSDWSEILTIRTEAISKEEISAIERLEKRVVKGHPLIMYYS